MPKKIFAIIGAGPKGLAVALKAKILEEFNLNVDQVVLIEKHAVAAHWSGNFGHTNGEMKLGTSPEKDLVFPLDTDVNDPMLNLKIRQRLLQFTWTSYLTEKDLYTDWVDSNRPAPTHLEWANYLQWVGSQLTPQITLEKAEVLNVDLSENLQQWKLHLNNGKEIIADRLMLTGPGKTQTNFLKKDLSIYDLETFWCSIKNNKIMTTGKLAIIGAGENAASCLLALRQIAPQLEIEVISPKGFISTRGESLYENQFYSRPNRQKWSELELQDRKDFIARTDLGVFSVHAMNILNEQTQHKIIPGRVIKVEKRENKIDVTYEYNQETFLRTYDQVVYATGFDHVASIQSLFTTRALEKIENALQEPLTKQTLELKIQTDLSLQGLTPSLHLPMLAGLQQGPGLANLSCLGLLADRVLIPQSKIFFVDQKFKKEINHLRIQEYKNSPGLSVDSHALKWKESDDQSLVMAIQDRGQLVATMRGELIDDIKLLEKKLECPWSFSLPLKFPILLLSRAATLGDYRKKGFNLLLRYSFLRYALTKNISFIVGTFISGSPREKSLQEMGYEFFINLQGWQQSTFRSHQQVSVAVLNLQANHERAINYCLQRLGNAVDEFPFRDHFPPLKMVTTI